MPPLGVVAKPGRSRCATVDFLRNAPNIRMSFIVDIVAMTFGRAYVLFPAIGALVIGGGPITVGLLTASAAIGTFLASLFSGPVAHVHRHGVAISRAIMVYGAFVAMFGVVVLVVQTGWFGTGGESLDTVLWPALVLACIALAGTGAADEISAIFRTTMLLTAAPDDMRGRLQGVFMVVVAGGPRVGDVYAGVAATLVALWFRRCSAVSPSSRSSPCSCASSQRSSRTTRGTRSPEGRRKRAQRATAPRDHAGSRLPIEGISVAPPHSSRCVDPPPIDRNPRCRAGAGD